MSQYKYVYLAGPISEETSWHTARFGWREVMSKAFDSHILPLSPLRRTPVHQLAEEPEGWERGIISPEGITYRDRSDVYRSDLVVVNFLDLPFTGRSGGTFIEVGWANAWNKPIILIDRESRHPMLDELAAVRVSTIEDGVDMVNSFLSYGV